MNKEKAIYLRGLKPEFSSERIFRRLGYRKSIGKMPEIEKQKLVKLMKSFWLQCEFGAIYRSAYLQSVDDCVVSVAGEFIIKSSDFKKFIGKSYSLYAVVVSAGKEICSLRDQFLADEDNRNAVVADAAGSEFVAGSLRLLKKNIEQKLLNRGKLLRGGWISPGIGDLSLEVQQDLFSFLHPERAGINLNEELIMVPEKSSTAFFAVLDR